MPIICCITSAGDASASSGRSGAPMSTAITTSAPRARAVGFVYSWSRFSAIFTSFAIAAVLKGFGTPGVFVFIAGAMAIVMASIGLMGPRTKGVALEAISR